MTTSIITWEGIAVEISYSQPGWCRITGHWHLEIRAEGETPLPITETGYRSHFVDPEIIRQAEDPETYVEAWLDHAARRSEWKTAQASRQQLSLF